MYMECRHIKANGCKCGAVALRGMPYCYYHMRLHRSAHSIKSVKRDAPIDIPPVEDCTAVQLALSQVLQDLGAKRIDPRRAGQILYGLQIASQIVDHRTKFISADEYVQNPTTDAEGDELGPEKFVCDDEDIDCDDCPFVDRCPNSASEEEEEADDEEDDK